MSEPLGDKRVCAGTFETIADADRAIQRLRAAGFSEDQLVVVCPEAFRDQLPTAKRMAENPTAEEGNAVLTGGVVGATLGGLALAATALTGLVAGPAALVLIGGGAIAGGFSSLVVSNGYAGEVDDKFKKAVDQGKIVVGAEVGTVQHPVQSATAERILRESGARFLDANPV